MVTLDKIYHASFVLKDIIRKTDMIYAPKINPDCEVYLKTENLQARRGEGGRNPCKLCQES